MRPMTDGIKFLEATWEAIAPPILTNKTKYTVMVYSVKYCTASLILNKLLTKNTNSSNIDPNNPFK